MAVANKGIKCFAMGNSSSPFSSKPSITRWPAFIELSTPQSNYAIKGQISLFNNPVIHLTPEQQELCLRDFDILEQRIKNSNHCFYQETLTNAMQTAILDFFDFHARVYEKEATSTRNASIMNSFLSILEEGTYRKHREVSFYADRLCITSKYLSEVSKNVSGFFSQLLDKSLYFAWYFTSVTQQNADYCRYFRHVQFFFAGLFQSLCATKFRNQTFRLQMNRPFFVTLQNP